MHENTRIFTISPTTASALGVGAGAERRAIVDGVGLTGVTRPGAAGAALAPGAVSSWRA